MLLEDGRYVTSQRSLTQTKTSNNYSNKAYLADEYVTRVSNASHKMLFLGQIRLYIVLCQKGNRRPCLVSIKQQLTPREQSGRYAIHARAWGFTCIGCEASALIDLQPKRIEVVFVYQLIGNMDD